MKWASTFVMVLIMVGCSSSDPVTVTASVGGQWTVTSGDPDAVGFAGCTGDATILQNRTLGDLFGGGNGTCQLQLEVAQTGEDFAFSSNCLGTAGMGSVSGNSVSGTLQIFDNVSNLLLNLDFSGTASTTTVTIEYSGLTLPGLSAQCAVQPLVALTYSIA